MLNPHYPSVWDNVYGFDFSPIKEVALREPLVDTVDFKAVVTDPFLLKVRQLSARVPWILIDIPHFQEFDLATVTKEELSFKAPFTLKATRDDSQCILSTGATTKTD
jgi:type I protein arginine methyltransferase